MTRVCFFGAWDPAYPRNRILREGLRRAGLEVIEARVAERRAFRRYPALLAEFLKVRNRTDVVFVPEFRHKDVPLANWLRHGRQLVFDPLVSRHDTLVGDWGLHAPDSGQARWNLAIDRWTLGLADRVLCDTWAHGDLFESLGVPRSRLRRVLVGAEDVFFAIGPPPTSAPVRIVYVGGFLPLHGVPVVIDAVTRLERRAGNLSDYRVTLVGKGIDEPACRAMVDRRPVARLEFAGPCRYDALPAVLEQAHIVLGAFGTTEKAGRVIPHKVYQGLAAGRAVVTGTGSGLREIFEPGTHLLAVPRGDAGALSEALEQLIVSAAERERLGARGRQRALEVATVDRIGASLRAVFEGGGEART